jgi:glycosyltransferase involved in cell wall biosynthesis
MVSALLFFPRGGSSHVARALATALPDHGWDVTIVSGSRSDLNGRGDATRFYAGLDTHAVDFTDALASDDPLAAPVPMHPSFEDRPGAPDRVMASLDDGAFERQVAAWSDALERAGAAEADVLHLHHLTPINEAARRVAPGVPVVGHLHGTELLMLEAIEEGGAGWAHASAWAERMRDWATSCEKVLLLSETAERRAERLLGIDPSRCLVLSNGFDPGAFGPRDVDRAAHWRRHLVDEPQGWRPGGAPGSVAYTAGDVERLADATVLVSVGRFTAVKRTPLLIEAFADARRRVQRPAALVVVGGHPDEWEGEHPAETVERIGAEDVFLAGWHEHDELPAFLNASDVFALASVREQFGQVLVEAMACGVPPIAVDCFGPGEIVSDGETGWLVEPDDRDQLADAIVAAVEDPEERARRGDAARRDADERFSWPALTGLLARTLDDVVAGVR